MSVLGHPKGGAGRVFWPSDERPSGPITFWRGNGGVDWEVEYVPAERLRGAVDALARIADPAYWATSVVNGDDQQWAIRGIAQKALDALGGQ
jgi:hypothetical protein